VNPRVTQVPGQYLAGLLTRCRVCCRLVGNVAVLTFASLGLTTAAWADGPVLLLQESTPVVQAWPAVTVLSDPGKLLKLEQVVTMQADFKPPQTAYGTLGLRKDAVWLHIPFNVSAQSSGQWVIDIDYAVINRIDAYLMANGQVVKEAQMGNLVPRAQRPVDARAHALPLVLKPGQRYDIYLRLENIGAMILPITFSKPTAFHALALREQMLQGLLTGLALCLLIYSLANWATLREVLFLKYALLVSGSLMFSLLQFGVGGQYVWPDNAWIELHMGGLSAFAAAAGSFLFVEQALVNSGTKRWFSALMKTGAALSIFFALCFSLDWIDIHQVTAIVGTLGLAPALMGLPGAIRRALRGDSVGYYLLVAWAVYFGSTAVLIEVIKGNVGVNFWTLHSFQFGATLDMLLFMRVLGLRTKALQSEVQRATRERDSFHSLAFTDPLTGLANRRSLTTSISAALEATGPNSILAVYMMDLDGFKQVNDTFGHDVGDELLVAVATRLKNNLRSSDVVARLGGDEFLVMSNGLSTDSQAQELGEKLLAAFAEPFALSTQRCQVGMTIGYALAPHDGQSSAQLLKRADAAMYEGKSTGKNCLRRTAI
jgi:diguanylate cyclase